MAHKLVDALVGGANDAALLATAASTFRTYAMELNGLARRVDESFAQAVEVILAAEGRIIISGMGKSGIIGHKIAATFSSTGTTAYFMHPAEAFHGDLGMLRGDDLVILISYSGETEEVVRLLPSLKRSGVAIVSLVGNPDSTVARESDIVLDVSVRREACPNNLAPTTSTMTALAMGDALAVALIERRKFMPHDFARFHPGGSLGRRPLTHVRDVMHTKDLPIVRPDEPMQSVIWTMTRGRLGMALVMDRGELQGIITDGDLRRALIALCDLRTTTAAEVMVRTPLTAREDELLAEAEGRMIDAMVQNLVVLNEAGAVTGVVQIYGGCRGCARPGPGAAAARTRRMTAVGVCSRGIRAIPHVAAFLGADRLVFRPGPADAGGLDAVVGLGRRETARRAVA